ncbi:MAG: 16S rRNA (guanine(966)-N(2))-methyltransferase RsmD [Ruminococcaceae bacterium]|nr:16S rRNA (guanine(966)-N(2))-methyltransferase RsmD [Oscillospiraceae bacterium]
MRIITGLAKGTVLKTLEGDATRPTAERVKEAVFSMIQFDIEGRKVLDLFSGSGQMALEALSRGASHATLVDKSREAVSIIRYNAEKTKLVGSCAIYQADYLDFIRRSSKEKFDIIFLDPPYSQKMYRPALSAMLEYGILKPTSLIICESNEDTVFESDCALASRFTVEKQSKYSKTYITVFKPVL